MEELEALSAHEQAAAAARECERLCRVNGHPLTQRAFAARAQLQQRQRTPSSRGIDSFLGAEDRRFLSKQSFDDRLPAAQASGGALFLQRAVEIGDVSLLLTQLQAHGAGVVHQRNCHGETLLHTAVLHGQLPIVQTLLQHGASPNAELPCHEVSQSTLESVAPRSDNFRYSRVLSATEATPVHYACAVGNLDALKLLLGPTASAPQFELRRPGSLLAWAITGGHAHIVEHLVLKKRIEADCHDEDGNNAVGIAALALAAHDAQQHEAQASGVGASTLKTILKLLLRREGIEINHKNMYGLTAFDAAESERVKQLLAQLGGRTARVLDMEKLLRWDRERSRREYTYVRDRVRRAIVRRDA
ncbi:hypothetical protein PybrP1_012774 [[Pythium] brassicae (nom. inval.)]|nr:hypothetical protein PybrP1_012774 [[Pythium] brassicae (nom. inval.)]